MSGCSSLSQYLGYFLLLFCQICFPCPSSMPMIHNFGWLLVFWRSCIFCLYFFISLSFPSSEWSSKSTCPQASIFCLQFHPDYWRFFHLSLFIYLFIARGRVVQGFEFRAYTLNHSTSPIFFL
jgi:hypothetical protein